MGPDGLERRLCAERVALANAAPQDGFDVVEGGGVNTSHGVIVELMASNLPWRGVTGSISARQLDVSRPGTR